MTTCALVVIQGKVQYGYCCDETIKAMIFLTTRVDYDVFEATDNGSTYHHNGCSRWYSYRFTPVYGIQWNEN